MMLVRGLVKDMLLRCMGQVLQQGLSQGKEPGVGKGNGKQGSDK